MAERSVGLQRHRRLSRRLQEIAYHEAGHAVVAWRCKLKFRHVTIKPDDDSAGKLLNYKLPTWYQSGEEMTGRFKLFAEKHIKTSFAGRIAEKKFRGKRLRSWRWIYSASTDHRTAFDTAWEITDSGEASEAYLRYCFLEAREIVDGSWQYIEKVARALLERETLTYREMIELFKEMWDAVLRAEESAASGRR